MTDWERFEIECTRYLNSTFGSYAKFYHQGGANSTVADIRATTSSGKTFFIDAKLSQAQCGQFVLLPDISTGSFLYSKQNATSLNDAARAIITHMNGDFDAFREAGTAGREIVFAKCEDVFADWIISSYKSKGVEYFITEKYRILAINSFSEHFNISAKYRIKRSGSSDLGMGRIGEFTKFLCNNNAHSYNITAVRSQGSKLFVSSGSSIDNERFVIGSQEFMFSARGKEYELRKLSNTYNANVIFSISLKYGKPGLSNEEFILQLC